MTNAFAYRSQKALNRYKDDPEIELIIKDIQNAQQGVMTFSKEVKKYMLEFIHKRYDDNKEVMSLIEVLKNWSKYETFNFLEIFQLQDECYFWYDFLNSYGVWKILQKQGVFNDDEISFNTLIRLVKLDVEVFREYPAISG